MPLYEKVLDQRNDTDLLLIARLLQDVTQGADQATLSFLKNCLQNEAGGIYTGMTRRQDATVSGKDVLSESQGLLMEYAVLSGSFKSTGPRTGSRISG